MHTQKCFLMNLIILTSSYDGTKYAKIKNSLNIILASYGLAKNQLDMKKKDIVDDTLTTLMSQWSDMTSRIAKNAYKKD